MHRCFLILEIFNIILDSMYELGQDGFVVEDDRPLFNKTFASLARTCRAFTAPALDRLWRRLEYIDPLIKVMPSCMWETQKAKRYSQVELHAMMRKEDLLRFKAYATRVQFLRGSCNQISPFTQKNVITAIAGFPGASLPLLPNLTEFVSDEIESHDPVTPVYILEYLTGPALTTFTFRGYLPDLASAWDAFEYILRPIPNVTSATFNPLGTISREDSEIIGDMISQWQNLQVLHSCALIQDTIDILASCQTLNTLCVDVDRYNYRWTYKRLPVTVRMFSLDASFTSACTEFLSKLKGNLTSLRVRFHCNYSEDSDMDMVDLFSTLASRAYTTRIEDLTIEPRFFLSENLNSHAVLLTDLLLSYLGIFSALVSLDLSAFCTATLDDEAYEQMADDLPQLKSLRMGMYPTREKPAASVGAVIALLRSCSDLQTLQIVFDGSIPPPPSMAVVLPVGVEDHMQRHGYSEGGVEEMKGEVKPREEGAGKGKAGRAATNCVGVWGASNQHLTEISVGHSPIGEDVEGWKLLAWCLKSVMPQLRKIECVCSDHARSWWAVERLLVREDDANSTVNRLDSS